MKSHEVMTIMLWTSTCNKRYLLFDRKKLIDGKVQASQQLTDACHRAKQELAAQFAEHVSHQRKFIEFLQTRLELVTSPFFQQRMQPVPAYNGCSHFVGQPLPQPWPRQSSSLFLQSELNRFSITAHVLNFHELCHWSSNTIHNTNSLKRLLIYRQIKPVTLSLFDSESFKKSIFFTFNSFNLIWFFLLIHSFDSFNLTFNSKSENWCY